jgi:lathosterol oxidase
MFIDVNKSSFFLLTLFSAAVGSVLCFWNPTPEKRLEYESGEASPYYEFNHWLNTLFLPQKLMQAVDERFGEENGFYANLYLRDLLLGMVVYYGVAGAWHVWLYMLKGEQVFDSVGRQRPSWTTIFDQMTLAQCSVFLYATLPVLSTWMVENKMTKMYFYIDEAGGWGMYLLHVLLYLVFVEVGVYWMHRKLHTVKFLYRYIHGLHHKYNKPEEMTPWCSIAFNPIDGIMQASPYIIALPFLPMHYLTHLIMFFFTGVWATSIHDSTIFDYEPVMGAKYYTIHHTHYHYNFGQFFIFCDYIWGSLRTPESLNVKRATSKQKSKQKST